MAPSALATNLPSFEVDGVEYPLLGTSLQSLVITWLRAGQVTMAATFNDWGSVDNRPPNFLWSDGRIVRTGVTIAVRFSADGPFGGTVATVESHLADSTAPVFALRAKGRDLVGKTAPPRTLRWSEDVLRMDAAIETVGPNRTARHVNAEALGTFALGPAALRPDMQIDIVCAGAMFDGLYSLTEISLQFDLAAGLRTQFSARSDSR